MHAPQASWRPGRVVARSVGCGACSGALSGIAVLAVVVLALGLVTGYLPGALGAVLVFSPYAAVVGGVIGVVCGMLASGSILLVGGADRRGTGRSSRARRDRAALAAGGGAALLPAVLGVWQTVQGNQTTAGALFCITGMAALGGMALGPCVLYRRRTGKTSGS